MYGGHITDDWDRRLCNTYLDLYVRAELLDNVELAPGFAAPPSSFSHKEYMNYIENALPNEGPMAFGLHPNAEIGFLTLQGENLLRTILTLQPQTISGEGGVSVEERAKTVLDDVLERVPEEEFPLSELSERLEEDRSPYHVVFYQEAERMNFLMKDNW